MGVSSDKGWQFGCEHLLSESLLDRRMPVKALIARAIDRLSEGAQFLCIVGTQVGERVLRNPRLGCQFIQAGEGRTCGHEMRLGVFLFQRTVPAETEQPDEKQQAQTLSDQRDQKETKGAED